MKKKNLITNFGKLVTEKIDDDKIIEKENYKMYLDKNNVIAIIPKVESIRKFLTDNFDVKESNIKSLNLDYNFELIRKNVETKHRVMWKLTDNIDEKDSVKEENRTYFDRKLLKVLLSICINSDNNNIQIKMIRDYPMWIETDELICILAPKNVGE